MQNAIRYVIANLMLAASAFAGVTISSPAPGSTSASPVHFVASASSSVPIVAMRIYVDNASVFLTSANNLDTQVPLATGAHNVVVQAWDSSGGIFKAPQTITVSATSSGAVAVSSPANNATVGSPFQVVATASAPRPIVGITAYLDSAIAATTNSASMNASISAGSGSHSLVVQAWDNVGTVYKQALTISVGSSGGPAPPPSGAIVKSQIQNMSGWQSCTVCAGIGGNGPVATLSMNQFQASPSLTGSSTKFTIGGGIKYGDALWWKQLGADNAATNFQYDLDFYITNPGVAQALEFDVNQGIGGLKFIFGSQCAAKSGVWDVWDSANVTWRSTGIPCTAPAAFKWHHLTWELRRTATQTVFVALTIDGVKHYVNRAYNAKAERSQEVNVAFQMDMDSSATSYSTWLDNVKLTYW
ncbi:MAG TPA: Ig-like domain-containing protein [Candidatus Angelobacter sp.]